MIRINPQWPKEWVDAHETLSSQEMLKRCRLLRDWMFAEPQKVYHYWDANGDLCIETWLCDRGRIFRWIKDNLVARGLCDECGRRTA